MSDNLRGGFFQLTLYTALSHTHAHTQQYIVLFQLLLIPQCMLVVLLAVCETVTKFR